MTFLRRVLTAEKVKEVVSNAFVTNFFFTLIGSSSFIFHFFNSQVIVLRNIDPTNVRLNSCMNGRRNADRNLNKWVRGEAQGHLLLLGS